MIRVLIIGGIAVGSVLATGAAMLFLTVGSSSPAAGTTLGANPCITPGSPSDVRDLTPSQTRNATTIVQVGVELGVPERGLVVAIATAMQESGLENLNHGDRDSLGLFQQRPSSGWGSREQITDPVLASRAFYGRADHTNNPGLLDVPGWQDMEVWEAAQAVQRSAFPTAYAKHEGAATAAVTAILSGTGAAPAGGCGNAMSCPPSGLAMEAGLTPDAQIVARCVAHTFGITNLLGNGTRASNPASDHATGRAVDVMIARYDTAQGRAQGNAVAEWVRANAARMGVKYVIWNARIWSTARAQEGWRPYVHPSGATDDNSAHRNHVHVSVYGNAAVLPTAAAGDWTLPVAAGAYSLTARFGECGAYWSSCHTGLDFATTGQPPVVAAAAGTVTYVGWGGAYGNLTKIDHGGGIETWYAHQATQIVTVGDQVVAGQPIGRAGATGNVTGEHLHFEVRENSTPTDPDAWLAAHGLNP